MDQSIENDKGTLAIFAGQGELPWIAAKNAREVGEKLCVLYTQGTQIPPEFRDVSHQVILTKLYTSCLATLKKHNAQRLIILGKVTRDAIYKAYSFDWRVLFHLFGALSQSDYSLFQIIERVLSKYGIQILPQTLFLPDLFLPEGCYGHKLRRRHLRDIHFGLRKAHAISQMDIGQTVVVGNRAILAVEAAEGSDNCIKRGGKLFRGKGAVVCKTARSNHDMRYDIPTVGIDTLINMQTAGCQALAFDANSTIIVNPTIFLKKATKLRISIVSVDLKKMDDGYLKDLRFSS